MKPEQARIVNEFLFGLDAVLARDNNDVVVFGATNLPFKMDKAGERRFPLTPFIDNPNPEDRQKYLKKYSHAWASLCKVTYITRGQTFPMDSFSKLLCVFVKCKYF